MRTIIEDNNMPDSEFKVLKRKEIYAILDGDHRDHVKNVYNEFGFGLPYMSADNLAQLCGDFAVELPGGSRWCYVEAVLEKAIDEGRCNDLLNFFFDRSRFTQLNSIDDIDEIDRVYKEICQSAIDAINHELRLGSKQLLLSEGKWHVVDAGQRPTIVTPEIDKFSIQYVQSLRNRCEENYASGNYDSVVTKSRTMLEELLIHILENNQQNIIQNGDLIQYYNAVKDLYGMRQQGNYDQRINSLLNGLERIVQSIAELRNTQSDAHGAGSGRIAIKEREARLIMNSSMVLCEYLVSVHQEHMHPSTP